jgi:hypothetical protein
MYCFRTSASLPSSLTTDSDGRSCSQAHARADGIIVIVGQTSALVHTRPAAFCSDVPSPSGGVPCRGYGAPIAMSRWTADVLICCFIVALVLLGHNALTVLLSCSH